MLSVFLRDACPRKFRQRTFGFGCLCPVVVFFGVVLLMFFLIVWDCSKESCLKNYSSCQVRVSRKNFREQTFGFWPLGQVGVFLVLFCLYFSYCVGLFSRRLPENSLLVRCAFREKFSGANFWF